MGQEVRSDKPAFVVFEPGDGQFRALLSVEGLFSIEEDPEGLLRQATTLYERYVASMRDRMAELKALRASRELTPARKIWRLGDDIFQLREGLVRLCLQIDDIYTHLVRDLEVKRKWLEKVVIFRRYVPSEKMIPEELNWGRCEKGTARVAKRLRDGLPPQ